MALQSPFYRGIYTYVVANKPDGVTVKSSPRYRGIYAYDATKKPSGVALDLQSFAPVGSEGSRTGRSTGERRSPLGRAAEPPKRDDQRATDNRTEGDDLVPAPWDNFTQHSQIDDYVTNQENGITSPDGWSSMTISQKKKWLDNNG